MAKTPHNFGSKGGYQKWLAYGHMHGSFEKTPGTTPVKINGKIHHVVHKTDVKHGSQSMKGKV